MLVPHHIDSSINLTPLYKGKKNISMHVSVIFSVLGRKVCLLCKQDKAPLMIVQVIPYILPSSDFMHCSTAIVLNTKPLRILLRIKVQKQKYIHIQLSI